MVKSLNFFSLSDSLGTDRCYRDNLIQASHHDQCIENIIFDQSAQEYSLGLLWRAVAEQNRISLNEGNIVGYDMSKSKGFSTFAINAAYQYSEVLGFSTGIDNLLDKTYSEHLNISGAALFGYAANEQFNNVGRNYWARVSMKF